MKLKNISKKEINVNGQPIAIDSEFEYDENQEIKNLITQGYLEKIKKK